MKAILTQTIGPSHKAGDVVKGQNVKIQRLISKGVATPDHSVMGMTGALVTWLISGIIILFSVMSFWPQELMGNPSHYMLSALWRWTLIIFPFLTITVALLQFYNAKNPYVAYFLATSLTFVGGLMIWAGHEKATSRYQDKRMSGLAALFLMPIGIICFVLMLVSTLGWNSSDPAADIIDNTHFIIWTVFMVLIMIGIAIGTFFDNDFQARRKRFIDFLRRKNTSIEYKDRAIKALRVFKSTKNQENFNARIIDIFEHTMEQDMRDVLAATGKNKGN